MPPSSVPAESQVEILANRRLTPCKDCGHQISVDAVTCPKCGSSEPRVKELILPDCVVCKQPVAGVNGDSSTWGAEPETPPVNFDPTGGLKTRGGFWIHARCAHRLMALNRPSRCSDCGTELPAFDLYPYSNTVADAYYKRICCPNCGKPDALEFNSFCFCGLPIFGKHEVITKPFYYRYRAERGEYWTGTIVTYRLHPGSSCNQLLPHERPLRKRLFRTPKVVTERQFEWHPTRGWNCHHPESGY
jgi:Zn finger protein HypA/HybF involved in hydrogenase expression